MSKRILALWVFIIVMLCGCLLLLGLNQKDKTLLRLETSLKFESGKFIRDNDIKLKPSESYIIFPDDLINDKYITEENINKYCIKKIIVKRSLVINLYEIVSECDHVIKNKE